MPVITICPFCQKQNLSINIQKGFFKDKTILKCNYCKNIWEYKGDNNYKLVTPNNNSKYSGHTLSIISWEYYRIHGLSLEDYNKKHEEEIEEKKQRMKKWLINQLSEGNIPIEKNPPIFLQNNELCHFSSQCSFYESKTISSRRGTYQGVSIPLGRGMGSVRMGSFSSSSYSHNTIKFIANGILILTNQRLIFKSDYKTLNIRLKNLIGIEPHDYDVVIFRDNKQKPELFKNLDTDIWVHAICGAVKNYHENRIPEGIIIYIDDFEKNKGIICPACSYEIKGLNNYNTIICPMCEIEFSGKLIKADNYIDS